jgi:hypothetical protein
MPPERAKSFKDRYYEITDRHGEGQAGEKTVQQLLDLVAGTPEAGEILRQSDPGLFSAGAAAPTQPPSSPGAPAAPTQPAPDSQGGTPVSDTPPPTKRTTHPRDWSADTILQFIKEIVTALLAIVLVWYTLRLAERTLVYVGETQKMSDAKDILLLLVGLVGVVLGYYFGRVPADARAAQAQQEATDASVKAETVTNKAEQIAEKAVDMATRGAPTRRGAADLDPTLAEDMRWLEGQMSELRSMSRTGRSG